MEPATLIVTLIIAGVMAGGVNFFISYLDLPFQKTSTNLLEDDWPKPKKLWLAILGYLLVGTAGAFLTPLINVLVGLKGYYPNKDFIVAFGYGLVFGYSTTRLLVGLIDSLLKKVSSLDNRLKLLETNIENIDRRVSINDADLLIPRPNWKHIYEGYPKTADGTDDLSPEDVFTSILGSDYDTSIFNNACATRVSLGILNASIALPKDFIVQVGKFKGKGFVASALNLKKYLSLPAYFGNADIVIKNPISINDVQNRIGNKNGIYIILGGFGPGVSGHSTLWVGDTKNVIGGHHYVDSSREIHFWELI
jgi:hypothetical protein